MPDDVLNCPPFPPLRWDGSCWVGEIALPSWAGFLELRGFYGGIRADQRSKGAALLTIPVSVESGIPNPPTPEQARAFQHLLDNEASVTATILQTIFDRYPEEKEAYEDAFDDGETEPLPDLQEPQELRSLMGLTDVHVLSMSKDDIAYVSFAFGCEWESGHGTGILTHRGRIVKVGQGDVTFDVRIARRDLEAEN